MKFVGLAKEILVAYIVIMGFFFAMYTFVSFVNWELYPLSFDEFTAWCRFSLFSAFGVTALRNYYDNNS